MVGYLGIAFVWLVGLTDVYLTHWMVNSAGIDGELNGVARWVAAAFGSDALFTYKIATLLVFTTAVLVLRTNPARRRLANHAVAFAASVHVALGVWWHVSLANCPASALI